MSYHFLCRAHKLNSKLNAGLTPQHTDSPLEYLEPEVSLATEDSLTSGAPSSLIITLSFNNILILVCSQKAPVIGFYFFNF